MNWKKTLLCTAALLATIPCMGRNAVYADEMSEESTFTVTVTNTPEGHTYAAYRVFKARTAPDGTLSDITWGDGVNADAVVSGLQDAGFAYKSKFEGKTSAKDIAAVISKNMRDADFVRAVSKLLVDCKAAKAADSDPAGNVLKLTGAGYYLTLDETELENQNDSRSAVLMFTSESSLTIDPKIEIPTYSKVIVSGNEEVKTEDYGLNDTIHYRLSAQLPDNYMEYEAYELHFFDSSTGIRYVPESFTVKADTAELSVQPQISGSSMTLDIADLKTLVSADLSGKNVTVDYEGVVTDSAVLGSAGNPNTSYITYSNDPQGTQKGRSPEERAVFYTYQLEVSKVDEMEQPLAGASFILEKKNGKSYEPCMNAEITQEGSIFTFARISDGEYRLTETKAPVGYNAIEPIEFTVASEHQSDGAVFSLTSLTSTKKGKTAAQGSLTDGKITIMAVNRKGVVLPVTGGTGTAVLYGAGILLLAAAVLLMQKKHEKE